MGLFVAACFSRNRVTDATHAIGQSLLPNIGKTPLFRMIIALTLYCLFADVCEHCLEADQSEMKFVNLLH
jgi:hypothetical protein